MEQPNNTPAAFEDSWGGELQLDLKQCNLDLIQNPEYLREWVKSLVKTIDMVAYGDPQIIHFGHGDPKLAGNTVLQFIETSHIVAHFNDFDGSAAINVFSCKPFDAETVMKHMVSWFDPEEISTNYRKRITT